MHSIVEKYGQRPSAQSRELMDVLCEAAQRELKVLWEGDGKFTGRRGNSRMAGRLPNDTLDIEPIAKTLEDQVPQLTDALHRAVATAAKETERS